MSFVSPDLVDQLNPEHHLVILAKIIPWAFLEDELSVFYHEKMGRPAKPIRLMTDLLILKQMENFSDERIVEARVGDPTMQYFCGESQFQWNFPYDPTDLSHFRKRTREEGYRRSWGLHCTLWREGVGKGSHHRYRCVGKAHHLSN